MKGGNEDWQPATEESWQRKLSEEMYVTTTSVIVVATEQILCEIF